MTLSLTAELQRIADALAGQLGRPVAIEDARLRLLVHTPHETPMDATRLESILRQQAPAPFVEWAQQMGIAKAHGVLRLPSNPALGTDARVVAPVRAQGALFGYVWLVDGQVPMTPAELEAVEDAAEAAGVVMHRDKLMSDVQKGRQRELLRDLFTHEAALSAAAADALVADEHFVAGCPVTVLILLLAGGGPVQSASVLAASMDRAARRLPPRTSLFLVRANQGVLLVAHRKDVGDVRRMAQAIHDDVASQVAPAEVIIGIGAVCASLVDARTSYEQALRAIRVAEVVPGYGPVATWSDLGVYRILAQLPVHELPQDFIHPGLLQLFAHDGAAQLVRTLETYLDNAGDVAATSAVLSVHRTSLYYRLSRIEKLTGLRLSDGGDRLAVHLSLKLARLAGAYPT